MSIVSLERCVTGGPEILPTRTRMFSLPSPERQHSCGDQHPPPAPRGTVSNYQDLSNLDRF